MSIIMTPMLFRPGLGLSLFLRGTQNSKAHLARKEVFYTIELAVFLHSEFVEDIKH